MKIGEPNMKLDAMVGAGALGVQGITLALQVDEFFRTLQLIIGTLSATVTFIYFVLLGGIKIYKWYKKSKKDGNIDEKELEELEQLLKDIKDKKED